MNTTILQKVSDELAKDKPDISYVRGMIETLIAMSGKVEVNVPMSAHKVIGSQGGEGMAPISTITPPVPRNMQEIMSKPIETL